MQLDLSSKGKLSIEDSILIDSVAPQVVKEYNKIIEELVNVNNLKGLDLILSVISRNPFHSSVLLSLCKLSLLEEKLNKNESISSVVIENKATYLATKTIIERYRSNTTIVVKSNYAGVLLVIITFLKFIKSLYMIIISWLWPRITRIYRDKPKGSIVFVDNFILPNSFNKEGDFVERYYTGYDRYLSDTQRQKVWYSPTLFGFKTLRQYFKMSVQSKKSRHNFLFQESWLTFYDYIYALYLTAIIPLKVKNLPLFRGCNIHQLLISEAKKDIFSPSLVMSICKFRFIKNLRIARVDVCQVVDWNENQAIDKALNLGFHKYYPDVVVKGYQGYVSPPYEAHKVPQSFELENSTLPSQLYVISENYKKTVLDSCPNFDVRVASAFRFSYLYDVDRSKVISDEPTILIALPMNINESISILNSCIQLQSIIDIKVTILVKHHPGYNKKEFAKKVPLFLDDSFVQTNDSMVDLLGSISLLISSASSVCAEAASLGIPVAIHGNRYGVTMSPIIDGVNSFSNNIFYSKSHLAKFIKLYLGRKSNNSSIVQTFFMDNGESAQALFTCE